MKLKATDLRDAVFVSNHTDNIVQRQQVALDLGVDVFALRADGQQLHQVDVVHEGAVFIHPPVTLRTHHLDQSLEGGPVIIKDQHILSRVHQLQKKMIHVKLQT